MLSSGGLGLGLWLKVTVGNRVIKGLCLSYGYGKGAEMTPVNVQCLPLVHQSEPITNLLMFDNMLENRDGNMQVQWKVPNVKMLQCEYKKY